MMMEQISESAVVAYLKSLPQGLLPLPIFLELARLMTLATIELVPLRRRADGEFEVLLVKRPANNDLWSGKWHVPGTVIRSGEPMAHAFDFDVPLTRLLGKNGELDGIHTVSTPQIVDIERRRVIRGDELSVIYVVEVVGEPPAGQFYSLENYPENVPSPGIVPHHVDFIFRAAKRLRENA